MKWREANPEEYRRQSLEKYRRARDRAIARLGSVCTCCGENRKTMLHIDHINNDGYLERAGKTHNNLARRVLKSGNPFEKYQILCANCNHSKARNGGTCEHKTEQEATG